MDERRVGMNWGDMLGRAYGERERAGVVVARAVDF
jgi:hypothetical protein